MKNVNKVTAFVLLAVVVFVSCQEKDNVDISLPVDYHEWNATSLELNGNTWYYRGDGTETGEDLRYITFTDESNQYYGLENGKVDGKMTVWYKSEKSLVGLATYTSWYTIKEDTIYLWKYTSKSELEHAVFIQLCEGNRNGSYMTPSIRIDLGKDAVEGVLSGYYRRIP